MAVSRLVNLFADQTVAHDADRFWYVKTMQS